MRSLLPGYPDNPLFEAIFINLLPANAQDAAVKHEILEDMAEAADKVLAEAPATAIASLSLSAVDIDCSGRQVDDDFQVDPVHAQSSRVTVPRSSSRRSQSKDVSLCFIHSRYGKNAFKCASLKHCKMREVISKPDASPGNANAGRQ